MRKTSNIELSLYDPTDTFDITGSSNSLNHNMEIIDQKFSDTPNSSDIEKVNKDIASLKTETGSLKEDLNYITVEQFGAKGDGTTDDTQSFKDAIAYAAAKKKKICLKGTSYYITAVSFKPNVTIEGILGVTKIILSGTYGLNVFGADNCVFKNFIIDGQKGATTKGLYIYNSSNILVENITVENCYDGIFIGYYDQTQHYKANNIIFRNIHISKSTRNGIVVAHAENVMFDNCLLEGYKETSALIDIEGHYNNVILYNVTFKNCVFVGGDDTGSKRVMALLNGYKADKTCVSFLDCQFNNALFAINEMSQAYVRNCTLVSTTFDVGSKNVVIEGIFLKNPVANKHGVFLQSKTDFNGNAIIKDSFFENISGVSEDVLPNSAIVIDQWENVSVLDCNFSSCKNGILFSGCKQVIVGNNIISNCGTGFYKTDIYGKSANIFIKNNLMKGNTDNFGNIDESFIKENYLIN